MRELIVAIQAARSAGEIILSYEGKDKKAREKTSFSDIVTQADLDAEKQILTILDRNFPSHSFLTEESGGAEPDSENLWIIDPIDGTNNFYKGFPFYAVSIGFFKKGRGKIGVVYAPKRNEMFYAAEGNGAYLNDKPISVSESNSLRDSLIITGMPYVDEKFDSDLRRIVNVDRKCRCMRMTGSAALDLCYVAKGDADGEFAPNLKAWDYAGGAVILQEAGGKVTGMEGEEFGLNLGDIVASNGKIHEELLKVMNE